MKLIPFLVVLLAGSAFAGEEKDVLARLASETAAEQAWGAHLAGKKGVRDAIPRLIEMIRAVPERKDKESRFVVRAAFDALIRLGASVPAKVLAPHLPGYFSTQALILLARATEGRPEVLLRVYDGQKRERMGRFGIAVGNLLCAEKTPGFASRLLRHVEKLGLNVTIVQEGFGGRGGSSDIGGGFGDGRLKVPAGYPPTVLYRLTTRERRSSVLLADGPRPIRWYRSEHEGRDFGFGSSGSIVEVTELAREWLGVLSAVPKKDLGLRPVSNTSLVWTDDAAYVKHVTARRDALLARFWKLVAALVVREALTLAEARALKPEVSLRIYDTREPPGSGTYPGIPDPPKRPRLPGEEGDAR